MATYTRVTPATLTNFSAVIADPTDAESANKLAQCDLQTRQFVYDYLDGKFDSATEMLKAAALADASLAGKVKGSTSNAGTQQGIVQGTISTPDLRNDAVSTAKIAANAITTALIADDQVTGAKIPDDAITTDHIAANTIVAGNMAGDSVDATVLKDDATGVAGAVTTDHIRSLAITSAKIAANAVSFDKLAAGSGEAHLLIAGAAPFTFASKAVTGDITITKDGVVSLVSKNECFLAEKQAQGVNCAASVAATWNTRGSTPAWLEIWRIPTAAFATLGGAGKVSLPVGTYVIECTAPAYKVGRHNCRLVRYNVGNVVQETVVGTAAKADAADACQTVTTVKAKITVAVSTDYLLLEHYTELLEAADGLGIASSTGVVDEYYATMHIKQVSS